VKVVRVIANISINETVGPQVASSNLCVELLIRILGKTLTIHMGTIAYICSMSTQLSPLYIEFRITTTKIHGYCKIL